MSSEVPDSETNEEAHLRARVRAAASHAPFAPSELDEMFAAVTADVAHERGLRARLRALSTRARVLAGLALALCSCVVTLLAVRRADWDQVGVGSWVQFAAALAVLALVLVVGQALQPLQRPLSESRSARWVSLSFAAWVLIFITAMPSVGALGPDGAWATITGSVGCLAIGVAVGGAVYAALRLLDRGPGTTRLAAAATAGVTANLVLLLHCPSGDPRHTVPGHLGAAVVLVAVALAAGVAERASSQRLVKRGPSQSS